MDRGSLAQTDTLHQKYFVHSSHVDMMPSNVYRTRLRPPLCLEGGGILQILKKCYLSFGYLKLDPKCSSREYSLTPFPMPIPDPFCLAILGLDYKYIPITVPFSLSHSLGQFTQSWCFARLPES